ncbi:hypothetical protein LTR56_010376 [Elasticomyces elasticus]|nr:hypothetical protein LTR56_010376 [Elasticomyces elasticus]KAK3656943.1 hypothetical protein LTR22_009606 [Elasticomyces elasticus]KAK5766175.1 hypothetical protein LTS12_003659 [Elasticomyces elasticus]
MQGVRTNRGCQNCRRRKKGCDFFRPTCSRCQRLGIRCTYEENKFTFVATAGPSGRTSSPKEISRSSTPKPPFALASPSQSSLAETDHDLQTVAAFWSIYLPHEDPALDGSIGGVLSAPWIPAVRSLAQTDSVLRTALEACAFTGFGWVIDNRAFVRRGLLLYGQALKRTNEALRDANEVQTDATLACCRVLSLFEMLNRGQASGGQSQVQDWQAHVDAIIQGMARRKPNAFTLLNWTPPRTSIRDDLFELAALLPGILQQMDMLGDEMLQKRDNLMAPQQLQNSQMLVEQYIEIGVQLREWEANAIELCRIRREELPDNDDDFDQSTPLRLIDVCKRHGDGFFFICTQYWAISIKVYSSTRLFHRQLSSFSQTTAQLSPAPLPDWMNPEPHALNIAHMTSHFFRPEAGLWSAQSAIFPVGHALFYFSVTGRRNSPTFKMMTEAFGQSKNGAVMRDFLDNVVSSDGKQYVSLSNPAGLR